MDGEPSGARGATWRGQRRRVGHPWFGRWLAPLLLIGGLVHPGAAAAQTGNVLLDFQFPPELSQRNLPAIIDSGAQQQVLYQDDYITTQSTTLG